jgi:outer membrane protein TolC
MSQTEISEAARQLERARNHLDYVQANYFEGSASERALKDAEQEYRAAERRLAQAHGAPVGQAQ